jgi:hypothetical protein
MAEPAEFVKSKNLNNSTMAISQKVNNRISEGLKKFQPLVASAKARDINESDTVVLLIGILADALGYDRYTEITTEKAIKGTFCDLAIKMDGKIHILIEVKAVGVDLKDIHVKQAVDYAANDGIDWVILTNSVTWRIYKILFTKPIQNILVCEFDLLNLKAKDTDDIEKLALLSREATGKSVLEDYFTQKQATSKFMLGNLLFEESVLNLLRKELKQVYPNIKTSNDEISKVLKNEVLKREIVEGEEALEARKKIAKANRKAEKAKHEKTKEEPDSPVVGEAVSE